ncbi:MAG: hypothetical protein M3Y82_00620 [Verrucomicrobiota bacterium]|nr:hypothetical protein [Verrucomicrobiota bacterium]
MVLHDLHELDYNEIAQRKENEWKEKINLARQQVREVTCASAEVADQTIRSNLYSALGVAFGLGLALSFFCKRS